MKVVLTRQLVTRVSMAVVKLARPGLVPSRVSTAVTIATRSGWQRVSSARSSCSRPGPAAPAQSAQAAHLIEPPEFFMPFRARLNPHLDIARRHGKDWARQMGVVGSAGVWDETNSMP